MKNDTFKIFLVFNNQYGAYQYPLNKPIAKGNNAQTLSENVADWIGIQTAYYAARKVAKDQWNQTIKFKSGQVFSHGQLFFIGRSNIGR